MLRGYLDMVVIKIFGLCLSVILFGNAPASAAMIRQYCAPERMQGEPLQLFLASNVDAQQAALQRNSSLQQGEILFSTREGGALFHRTRIKPGDCVLLNLQEAMRLTPVAVSSASVSSARQERISKKTFFPVVFFVQKTKAKQYGLLGEQVLRRLRRTRRRQDVTTADLLKVPGAPDLVLIYIFCPPDRSSPCDLTIKQHNCWLLDQKTGRKFHLSVLARSVRDGRPSRGSRRIRINHDTPQGIYTIWGTMIGGGDSSWFQTARIDLDAALPPINAQPYPINSFLLSRMVPETALDDYWINEWPLAYSLGRIALRIAPGDFEAQQNPSLQSDRNGSLFHPTHGCINTGDQQGELLQILLEAGVFHKEDLIAPLGTRGKKWSVSPKLGKAFVIVKDREGDDDSGKGR